MNSYVGMTIVKKEQGQDEYFNQQSILLTLLLAYIQRFHVFLQGESVERRA